MSPEAFGYPARYLALELQGAVMVRGEVRHGREQPDVEVVSADGDLLVRVERFPLEEVDPAMARLAELGEDPASAIPSDTEMTE